MEDLLQFVPDVHFEQIPIKNLVSNQEYQRNLSEAHIRRAAANFDLHQINPVKVSRRSGVNYVFNGQHTIEIVALVSGSRDTPVWCMIYDDLDYTREADIFANQLKYVKPLLPYEIFMANIEAGNDKQLIIKSLVESYGLALSSTKSLGSICAVSTIENIFDKYGFHVLDRVLRLCAGTWEGAADSFSANMLNGTARIIDAYGEGLKDESFKERLSKHSVREISRTAKERGGGTLGYAEAMINLYNKKTHSALPVSRLHIKKNRSIKSDRQRDKMYETESLFLDSESSEDKEISIL